MLKGEPLPKKDFLDVLFTALAPDGKSLFLSGVGTSGDGFWRDGQVWKMDLATRIPYVFFGLSEEERKDRSAIGHGPANRIRVPGNRGRCGRPRVHLRPAEQAHRRGQQGWQAHSIAADQQPRRSRGQSEVEGHLRHHPVRRLQRQRRTETAQVQRLDEDDAPSTSLLLRNRVGTRREPSLLTVVEDKGETLVWVAYTLLPARVYKDTARALNW